MKRLGPTIQTAHGFPLLEFKDGYGVAWPVPMPPDYIADTRMHLNRAQTRALIRHLQAWLDTGTFKVA